MSKTFRGKGGWVKKHGRWIRTSRKHKARRGRGRRRVSRSRRVSKRRGRGRRTRSARSRAWTPTMRARAKARWYQRQYKAGAASGHMLQSHEELLGMANPRRGKRRGRNPAKLFSDGTKLVIDGGSATIYTRRGEVYDYDGISSAGRKAIYRAKSLTSARKILGRSAVLRSINPKRRRNCGYNPPISKAQARAIKAVLKRHGY